MISIMMPVFNAEKYIKEAVLSVYNQTYEDWELIIINDGSTDKSISQIPENEKTFIYHQENKGEAAARNLALSKSSGVAIAKLDADDWWHPSFLEKTYNLLVNYDLVSTEMEVNGIKRKSKGMIPEEYMKGDMSCAPVNASIVAWRWVYELVGNFDESLDVACDSDWDMRACLYDLRWGFINEPLYFYRKHPDQLTKRYKSVLQKTHKERLDLYASTFQQRTLERERTERDKSRITVA